MSILLFVESSEVGANIKCTVFAKNCGSDGCKLLSYGDRAAGKSKH